MYFSKFNFRAVQLYLRLWYYIILTITYNAFMRLKNNEIETIRPVHETAGID